VRIGAGFPGFLAGSAQGFGDNPRISRGTAPLFTPGDGTFHLESYTWAYPPQPSGARLTLTIRSFAATSNAAVSNAVGVGPWRLPIVIP